MEIATPIVSKFSPDGILLYTIDPEVINRNFDLAKAEGKRHYSGLTCSWHGYYTRPWCPKCGGMMQVMPESAFWGSVLAMESAGHKGWVDICRWTTEKCFPDFETMLQVYNSIKGTRYKPQQFVPF